MVYKMYMLPNTTFHHKNQNGLQLLINEGYFNKVNNIDESHFIYIPCFPPDVNNISNVIDYYDIKYKNKLFIFGPHFCVFPTPFVKSLDSTINNNIVFNILSDWCELYVFKPYLNGKLSMVKLPFPLDVNKFKPDESISDESKNIILIYIKHRRENDYNFIIDYINNIYNKNNLFIVSIIKYGSYNENDYINTLKKTKFCIWIGCHESQGFGLLEALSLNVPLLVFDVTNMGQEAGFEDSYEYLNTKATTLTYWDNKCGEFFTNKEDFIDSLNKLSLKLESNEYNPREFIINNLSPESAYNNYWKPLIESKVIL